jgi:hypothetical protein
MVKKTRRTSEKEKEREGKLMMMEKILLKQEMFRIYIEDRRGMKDKEYREKR